MPEVLEALGVPNETRPYLPLVAAIRNGVVDLATVVPQRLTEELGILFSRGEIPAADNAGLLEIGGITFGCDHVAILGGDKSKVEIAPTSKNSVNTDGTLQETGGIMLSRLAGVFKLAGAVVDHVADPWLADRINAVRTQGRLAVASFGLEAAEFEITDIDSETGIITAKPRRYNRHI